MRYAGNPHISDDVGLPSHSEESAIFKLAFYNCIFFSFQKALQLNWCDPSEVASVVMGHRDALILVMA